MRDGDTEIRILGPVELSAGGRVLRLKGRLQRALLAILALHANRTVPTYRLIDALWDEDPPATAKTQVRRQVSKLRRTVGESLVRTEPAGYRLSIDPARVDARVFERRVAEARRAVEQGRPRQAGSELAGALAMWRGPALADLNGAYFAAEAARLEEPRLVAQEYAEARMATGAHRDLIGDLAARVRRNPLRERPRAQLMLALHRAGRQAEALTVYREGRDVLADELGLEPSPELTRLHQAILTADPHLDLPATGDSRDADLARLRYENDRLTRELRRLREKAGLPAPARHPHP